LGEKTYWKKASKSASSKGTFGHISCWAELIPVESGRKAAYDIRPPEKVDCELRAVIWETKAVAFHDQVTKCNDLFVKGKLGHLEQETDTHWRCRAIGSFNWRMKFPVSLPFNAQKDYGMDVFKLQLFDRDILHANEIIGEAEVKLNLHKMLDKAYKRRKSVQMKRRVTGRSGIIETDKLWFDAYHPEVKDEDGNPLSQGKLAVTFEMVMGDDIKNKDNSIGRGSPNNYPVMPDPVGRFSFDILHPLNTLRELIGPEMYRKLCMIFFCLICLVIAIAIAYFFVPSYIAVLAGKI